MTLTQHVERVLAFPWRRFALGCLLLLLILLIDRWVLSEPRPLILTGLADETAHLSTMVILLMAFPMLRNANFVAGCLIASVAIDIDHIPLYLGSDVMTAQTNRPFTHGIMTIGLVLALGLLAGGRWRAIGLGLAVGLSAHFLRDATTSTAGVPLLWPGVATGFTLPYPVYIAVLALALLISLSTAATYRGKQRGPGQHPWPSSH